MRFKDKFKDINENSRLVETGLGESWENTVRISKDSLTNGETKKGEIRDGTEETCFSEKNQF